MEILKNSTHTVEILSYNSEGFGVARIGSFVVFVKGAMRDEVVEIKIVKVTKTCAWGKLLRIIKASKHRIKPDCKFYKTCGGCGLRHMDYTEELKIKEDRINDALWKIGKLNLRVQKIIAGDVGDSSIERYRNKAVFPVSQDKEGNIKIGMYQARSHNVIDVNECKLQSSQADIVIGCVKAWMTKYKITAYDEKTGKGDVRHIFVRTNYNDEVLVCLITKTAKINHIQELIDLLKNKCKCLVGLVQNVNDKITNTIRGPKYMTLYGYPKIKDVLNCGDSLQYYLDPASFFQVNRSQAEKLYNEVVDMADLSKNDNVLDLYCGTGTITLLLAKHSIHVTGVEIVKAAIENAKENSVINKINNVNFDCLDAKKFSEKAQKANLSFDVICVDPPRKGLDMLTIEACTTFNAKKIIYVSCNPATLARDLQQFSNYGYNVQKCTMVDMFPRTAHVESVVLLTKE